MTTTPETLPEPLTRCSMCRHQVESHDVDPETGFRPCRSIGHPKGLTCADCKRLTSPDHIAALMALRNADEPLLNTTFAAFVVTRDHVRRQFGEAEQAFFTDIHESAVASALIEARAEIEREIRVRVADEIAALRHDRPMSANGSADRAFTSALVLAERTARGVQ